MILRKYMSLIGIGSAQIDLILLKEIFNSGDPVNGYFLIKGGTIEQQLKRIDCDLVRSNHTNGTEMVIGTTTILSSARIQSEELNKIPFTFQLPQNMHASTDNISYRFMTRLTFHKGKKSIDHDTIQII